MSERITAEQLKSEAWRLDMSLSGGKAHVLRYQFQDTPIFCEIVTPKAHGKFGIAIRSYFIARDPDEREFKTAEEVVTAFNDLLTNVPFLNRIASPKDDNNPGDDFCR